MVYSSIIQNIKLSRHRFERQEKNLPRMGKIPKTKRKGDQLDFLLFSWCFGGGGGGMYPGGDYSEWKLVSTSFKA